MSRLKSKAVVALALLGLLATSGLAMAASEDDTVFNFGYLEGEQFFAYNASSIDYQAETPLTLDELRDLCSLDGETISYLYEDGTVSLAEGQDALDEACGDLMGGYVSGPNGQINHGMFMKLFNSLYDGKGRGCLVRHLAQSDLGKGDQQVKVSDVDPEFQPTGEGDLTFTGVDTDCVHGKKATAGEDDGPGNSGKAKDKWGEDGPGKSGGTHGKSGEPHGHND